MSGELAIIGAGASGVLVAIHLMRAGYAGTVFLIDRSPVLGEGVAYGTQRAEHLLNVPAGGMSAFDDDPDHFVRFLEAQGSGQATDLRGVFAQRRHYAAYLRDTLAAASAGAGNVHVLADEVVSLRRQGRVDLEFESGRTRSVDGVVFALGNRPRDIARGLAGQAPAAKRVRGWDFEAVADIRADERVVVLGSGLSMVDAVLTLAANDHAGSIDVVSRHGFMPLPHAVRGSIAFDIEAFRALGLRRRTAKLRETAAHLHRQGQPWQWLMDALRPHNEALWRGLSLADQQRFLRHVARYWDVHRHRIPQSAAATLVALEQAGRLRHRRGRPVRCEQHDDGLRLSIEHHGVMEHLDADRLVDCTGLQMTIRHTTDRLIASLHAAGIIRPGRHGIGIDTDDSGALIGQDGQADPRLLTLGSARIGSLWESLAVPDLRRQAAALAQRLAAGTAGDGITGAASAREQRAPAS